MDCEFKKQAGVHFAHRWLWSAGRIYTHDLGFTKTEVVSAMVAIIRF